MIKILKEIIRIKGVIGAFIANMNGHVAASIGELGATPLKSIAIEIRNFLQTNKPGRKHPEKFQFTYDNKTIIIQVLEIGFIVVLCKPDAITALLRLTLNVAFSKIKNIANIPFK